MILLHSNLSPLVLLICSFLCPPWLVGAFFFFLRLNFLSFCSVFLFSLAGIMPPSDSLSHSKIRLLLICICFFFFFLQGGAVIHQNPSVFAYRPTHGDSFISYATSWKQRRVSKFSLPKFESHFHSSRLKKTILHFHSWSFRFHKGPN